MTRVTFQVVEGLESGRVFRDVATPLTIGREEDNDVQLNDERISRFHVKIQENSGRIILTDLESTNGTRVNGHPVRLRVLQPGDLIMVGRSVLLMGGPEELQDFQRHLQSRQEELRSLVAQHENLPDATIDAADLNEAFPHGVPPVPAKLTPLQIAELSNVLDYLRTELLSSLSVPTDELIIGDGQYVRVSRAAWVRLESLVPEIARLINSLTAERDT